MPFTPKSYYEKFKWDSVFIPDYKLISIENKSEHVIANVAVSSSKFNFLKNNPMTYSYQFYFESGKINKIISLDCSEVDRVIWKTKVNALVAWIKINYPELDGFIYDLTMKGFINYINAIVGYKKIH